MYITKLMKAIVILLAVCLHSSAIKEEQVPEVTAVQCHTVNMFFEARGESLQGMKAVAATVVNRSKHKSYPSTICKVIFQPKQFSWTYQQDYSKIVKLLNADTSDLNSKDRQAYQQAEIIAQNADKELVGVLPEGVLHYHAKYVKPAWAKAMKKVKQVGQHLFYNSKTN